jgi:hypothetical protein
MNKIIIATLTGLLLGFIIVMYFQSKEIKNYKQAYEFLKDSQNVVIMKMDDSCYTQFTNNFDKALYIKMRFGDI